MYTARREKIPAHLPSATHNIITRESTRYCCQKDSNAILGNGALVWLLVLSAVWWAVHQESAHLHLTDSIEGDQTDVSVWESLGALLHLSEDLGSISASEHWKLPHCPVAVVLVSRGHCSHSLGVLGSSVGILWVRELKAWSPSVADHVVHLLGDLVIRESWEEREGLEELQIETHQQRSARNHSYHQVGRGTIQHNVLF